MTPDATAPDDTTLSIERAAGLLGTECEKEDEAPDTSGANEPSAATGAEEANDAETSENGDASPDSDTTAEDEAAEKEEETAPRLDPPRWWNKDAKTRFASLPPE